MDELSIRGVQPLDQGSRNPNGKNRKNGGKFSLEGEKEENPEPRAKELPKNKVPEARKDGPSDPNGDGIDIVI